MECGVVLTISLMLNLILKCEAAAQEGEACWNRRYAVPKGSGIFCERMEIAAIYNQCEEVDEPLDV